MPVSLKVRMLSQCNLKWLKNKYDIELIDILCLFRNHPIKLSKVKKQVYNVNRLNQNMQQSQFNWLHHLQLRHCCLKTSQNLNWFDCRALLQYLELLSNVLVQSIRAQSFLNSHFKIGKVWKSGKAVFLPIFEKI